MIVRQRTKRPLRLRTSAAASLWCKWQIIPHLCAATFQAGSFFLLRDVLQHCFCHFRSALLELLQQTSLFGSLILHVWLLQVFISGCPRRRLHWDWTCPPWAEAPSGLSCFPHVILQWSPSCCCDYHPNPMPLRGDVRAVVICRVHPLCDLFQAVRLTTCHHWSILSVLPGLSWEDTDSLCLHLRFVVPSEAVFPIRPSSPDFERNCVSNHRCVHSTRTHSELQPVRLRHGLQRTDSEVQPVERYREESRRNEVSVGLCTTEHGRLLWCDQVRPPVTNNVHGDGCNRCSLLFSTV